MSLVEAPPPPPQPPPSADVVPHPLAIVDDDDAVSLVSAPDSVATATPAVACQDAAADGAAATAAAAEAAFLSRLLSPTPVTSLTPDHLAAVRDGTLHATLPLVLAVLTRMGDTPGGRRPAVAAAAALRDRLSAGRALKLRFLLLLRTPGYARWHARLVYQPRCYEAAAAAAAAAAVARPSPSLASVACSAVSCGSAPPWADAAVDAAATSAWLLRSSRYGTATSNGEAGPVVILARARALRQGGTTAIRARRGDEQKVKR